MGRNSIAAVCGLAVAIAGPAAAQAASPLDPVVAALITADVPGIAQASSAPGSSSAAAADLPGVLTVGKASTNKGSSKVVVAGAGGQELITKQGDAGGGHYTGPAAAAGDGIDAVNRGLCPKAGPPRTTCVALLESTALSTATPDGKVKANTAWFNLARVQLAGMAEGAALLPASASTTSAYDRCVDLAMAFVVGGTGALTLTKLIGPKLKLGGIIAPC